LKKRERIARTIARGGSYESIDMGERFQGQAITMKPGAALSLQLHHHRAEHWMPSAHRPHHSRRRDDHLF